MPTRIRPTLHAELLRPDDLLHLQVDGSNLRLIADENRRPILTVEDRERPAFLRFTFAPQTIAESAFFEAALVPGTSTPVTPENSSTRSRSIDFSFAVRATDPSVPKLSDPAVEWSAGSTRHVNAARGSGTLGRLAPAAPSLLHACRRICSEEHAAGEPVG